MFCFKSPIFSDTINDIYMRVLINSLKGKIAIYVNHMMRFTVWIVLLWTQIVPYAMQN